MPAYTISPCTIPDGSDISRNNMSAFWPDEDWVASWRHTTLEEHITQVAKRYPRKLLNDHTTLRHQKAVDPETGRFLGYARWVLPSSHATTVDGKLAWPEALGPVVGPEEEAEIQRVAATAVWNPNSEPNPVDEKVSGVKKELLGKDTYIILDFLAVHPENQGKGVGSALVQSGIKQAELLGLKIFVLAFKRGMPVYKRLGFRIEREIIQDNTKYGGSDEYAVYYMIYDRSYRQES